MGICEDDLQYFFLFCDNVNDFWDSWHNWWIGVTGLDLTSCDDTAACILFGYPGEDEIISVLNYCVLIAKYYIYSKKIIEQNNLDLYHYLIILKQRLQFEQYICSKESKDKFLKFEQILSRI